MTNEETTSADDELDRSVSDQLFSDPDISLDASIVVSVENGEVSLHGTVTDFAEKRAARKAVQLVHGVRSVKDELEVLGPSDTDLRRAVLEALQMDTHMPATIAASVDEGLVTLTGRVRGQFQRDAAGFITENVPGVVDVDNQISVEEHALNTADSEDPLGRTLDRLVHLQDLDRGWDSSRLELRDRLTSAVQRIQRLRSDSEAAGNVVRFRLARYVEALESAAIDVTARLAALAADESYEVTVLKRDVTALEGEIPVAEAKLDAARAEGRDDLHGEMEAEVRAFKGEAGVVRSELDRTFRRRRKPQAPAHGSASSPTVPSKPTDREDPGTAIEDGD